MAVAASPSRTRGTQRVRVLDALFVTPSVRSVQPAAVIVHSPEHGRNLLAGSHGDPMQGSRIRRVTLEIGLAALAAFAWCIATYNQPLAVITMVIAVPSLSVAAGRRWLAAPILVVLFGATFWEAFGTTAGYFWLNRTRLEALVAEIQAIPAITSLELGVDHPLPKGMGRAGRYDSYRFINGQLVTQYREQVAPTAFQPVLREIDVLRELGVSFAQYEALRGSLEGLHLAGFDRRQDGEIALNEPMPGGTPWGTSFLYRPASGPPSGDNVQTLRTLAPRWFHVWQG